MVLTGPDGEGSSPLARGLPRTDHPALRERRIIPARAGFTMRSPAPMTAATDHPRSRGVYARAADGQELLAGIIPARAGFTSITGLTGRPPGDHPRSRGVYGRRSSSRRSAKGSSPLARGLPIFFCAGAGGGGIIPARAGFTGSTGAARGPPRDHPRSRGVYPGIESSKRLMLGSSPLARGLPNHLFRDDFSLRIIPARAGFTVCWSGHGGMGRDHPRSRGVYVRTAKASS